MQEEAAVPKWSVCGLHPVVLVVLVLAVGAAATAAAAVEADRSDRDSVRTEFLDTAKTRAITIADGFYSYLPNIGALRRVAEGPGIQAPVRDMGVESLADHVMDSNPDQLSSITLTQEIDSVHQDVLLAGLRAAYPGYSVLDRGYRAISSTGIKYYDDATANATIGPRMNVFTTVGEFSFESYAIGIDLTPSEVRRSVIEKAVRTSSVVISEAILLLPRSGPKRGVYVTAPVYISAELN